MKLKGTMVLELTDEATGEVESITEENMVTEAVNDILGMNPMGVFYSEEELGDVLAWNNVLLPMGRCRYAGCRRSGSGGRCKRL